MNKQIQIFATAIVSLSLLIGTAFADVDWTNSGTDRLWRNSANWQDSTGTNRVPDSTDKVAIRQGGDGPVIDSGTTALTKELVVGDWSSSSDSITITGGSLTTDSWFILGYGSSNEGVFNISGGTITCRSSLTAGREGTGRINMTAGTLIVTGTLGLATNGGTGRVQLNGGTITCSSLTISAGGTMDIADTGKLLIDGDALTTVNSYISDGRLTGFDGLGTLSVDYNITTPGKTTIVANTPEKAANPSPGNGAVGVSTITDLTWTAGANAVSHNVYFGTDPTPDQTEFQASRTETTFDPGTLDLNTTYYWRVDEINPDHPDSPWKGVTWSFKTQTTGSAGKIVYPWRSTTAIAKAGQAFDVWFDADPGQIVNTVELQGPYHTVNPSHSTVTGNWVYDQMSGNRYDTRITVTVPPNAPADRYDLVLRTSLGSVASYGAVKVVTDYKDSYYIMHMSDGHLYQYNHDTDVLLARKSAMIDIANIIDAQIIIETGDNMYNVRNHPEREVYYFLGNDALGTKGMADASAATFLVPGDHDALIANDWPQATEQENADFFNDYWGLQSSCFKYGNGRFMPLNNAWAVSTSSAKNHQYQIDQAVAWLNGQGSGGNFFLTAGHCYDKMHEFVDDHSPLDLVLAGDKHHVGTSNPYPFDDGSPEVAYIARSIRDHFEFNLFEVNNTAGTFTTPSGTNSVTSVLYSGNQDTPSTWVSNLELNYTKPNDGSASTNSAEFVNRFSFPINGARVRFVMPKGTTYGVSAGTIDQQFDGDQYRIVDVNIDLNASTTTTLDIAPAQVPIGASAKGEHPDNGETADKAFDGDPQTKWLDFSPTNSWVQWRYADGTTVAATDYALTSANDHPDRDPSDWNLLGSNDGGLQWQILDSRTDETFTSRFQRRRFSIDTPDSYNIYRLEIAEVADVTTAIAVQLAEMELLVCLGPADLDCDNDVDLQDVSSLAQDWLTEDSPADIAQPKDGRVDLLDFAVLSNEWL
ncbi:F5/8 type C domain protein [Anaerohalosphaera lusitana]|uniref:F5/8 type C domain protein n=1 Tax=Anaerohalosphaera lusitana TaxID=1936003 RepID=A0A1U9NPT8_9BACT|nr:hypothetical protein [Anaerohalosphaera lusitana]AQT69807.1 F5/8 type C domain protein [Anaerohalosphaera lusitana]